MPLAGMSLYGGFTLILLLFKYCLTEYYRKKNSPLCNVSNLNFILSSSKIFEHLCKQTSELKTFVYIN